jgi:RecJ-like exonuclease
MEKGEIVEVKGIVNSLPKTLGSQYFYIEDDGAGTQIYSYDQAFPELKLGDFIRVIGELSTTSYLRIKVYNVNDILIINSNNEIKPKIISSVTLKDNIGKLVIIKGKIIKKTSQTLYISDDNNSNIKINIRSNLGFKSGNFDEGDILDITGIVIEDSNNNISISPRSIKDIVITSKYNENDSIVLSNDIIDVTNLLDNTLVKIQGIVINLPNNFSSQYFYIMDGSCGIQIYSYNKLFPDLSIGDEIEVIGKTSSSGRRLKIYDIADIKIISKQNSINIDNLKNNLDTYYGRLIYFEGTIIEKKGLNIIIENNGQKYNIYLKSKTNIKSSSYKVGNYIKIIGIVELLNGVYKIVPRYESDITNYSSQKVKLASASTIIKKSQPKLVNSVKSQKYLNKTPKKVYNTMKINIVKSIIIFLALNLIFVLIYLFYEKIIHSYQTNSSQNC